MNLSTAIMLVNKEVRPVKVSYEPDTKGNPGVYFKTLDPSIKTDDYVVVPTGTRHGMTVCKVTEIDYVVDFNTTTQYMWVVGKVDKHAYEGILKQEQTVLDRIGKAEENRMRKQLAESMGLGEVNFSDLDIVAGTAAIPAPSTPRGAPAPAPDAAASA
jgi:hypothetical protein